MRCVKYFTSTFFFGVGDGTHWCSLSTTTTALSSLPFAPAPPSIHADGGYNLC